MASLRLTLGQRGVALPVLFNLIQLVGWGAFEIVVMRDAASLLEVAGDAALIFPAAETDGLVQALRTLFAQPEVGAELAQRGLARSGRFTWERAAQETLAVYTAALL